MNYIDTVEFKLVDEFSSSFKKANKLNFLKTNDIQTELAMVYHFLHYSTDIDDKITSSIKSYAKELVDMNTATLDTGIFKFKSFQSNSSIVLLFYNDRFKLSKTSFANHVITLYKLINDIFVRSKLTYLTVYPLEKKQNQTSSLYVIAFTVEHGPEITISIQDIIDRYKSLISTEFYNTKMDKLTRKSIEEEPEEEALFDIESANMTNYFNFS